MVAGLCADPDNLLRDVKIALENLKFARYRMMFNNDIRLKKTNY